MSTSPETSERIDHRLVNVELRSEIGETRERAELEMVARGTLEALALGG
jgi:hypothetical protein